MSLIGNFNRRSRGFCLPLRLNVSVPRPGVIVRPVHIVIPVWIILLRLVTILWSWIVIPWSWIVIPRSWIVISRLAVVIFRVTTIFVSRIVAIFLSISGDYIVVAPTVARVGTVAVAILPVLPHRIGRTHIIVVIVIHVSPRACSDSQADESDE